MGIGSTKNRGMRQKHVPNITKRSPTKWAAATAMRRQAAQAAFLHEFYAQSQAISVIVEETISAE